MFSRRWAMLSRVHVATVSAGLCLLCAGWVYADEKRAPCPLLAEKFDSIGYRNGTGRVWEVEDRVWLPLYGETMNAIGRNAQTVDVSTALYHVAEQRVGGRDKLPSIWTDAIDIDAEMSRLLGGRRFDSDFIHDARLNIEGGSVSGIVLPTEPQKLIVTQIQGTLHCEQWTSFIADDGKWRKEAETGEDDPTCYHGGTVITLAGAYYTARLETYDRVALAPIIGPPECAVSLRFDSRLTMRTTRALQGDDVIAAIATDLNAILDSYQDAGSKADWTKAVEHFAPEGAPQDLDDRLLLDDINTAGPLPILGLEAGSRPKADARKTAQLYQFGSRIFSEGDDNQQALFHLLDVIPGDDSDAWNELAYAKIQFFGYGDRHFIWVMGTPHIGWRELSAPGFGVFELVDGKPTGRLGGHIRYVVKYQGAQAN